MKRRLSRRTVLVGGGAVLGVALVSGLGIRALRQRRRLLIDRLIAPYLTDQAAQRLGQAYLRATPEEASQRTLIAALLPLAAGLQGHSESDLLALVRAQIDGEFATRRSITLQNWQLSQTEARLFALASLRSGKAAQEKL